MPKITEIPPQYVIDDLSKLNVDLDNEIPYKNDNNLLIATWNLRHFGSLTEKWMAVNRDSPKRDLHSLLCIIEIIKRFDVIAVQEVKGNIKCLRDTMKMLGEDWSFIMTDVTKGTSGNNERFAFIFNSAKVKLSGLACEIVIPDEELSKDAISKNALTKQFARTPYAVSFKANDKTFVLLTLHVLYGDNVQGRVPELKALADWMYDWAADLKKWGFSLITLGDFNIERNDDIAYQAFVSTGLHVPDDMHRFSRTVFGNLSFYDQIAWFTNKKLNPQINLKYKQGGTFNFKNKVLRGLNYTTSQLSYRISDHLPLWAEFEI
jgi:exonuclease III